MIAQTLLANILSSQVKLETNQYNPFSNASKSEHSMITVVTIS